MDEVIGNERNRNREQTSNETEEEQSEDTQNNDDEEKPVSLTLNLPYAGVKGEQLVKKGHKICITDGEQDSEEGSDADGL